MNPRGSWTFLAALLLLFGCSLRTALPGVDTPSPGMVLVPSGEFAMGSENFPDAVPIHRVAVKGFWMDEAEVTNQQFAEFVVATGYTTSAERSSLDAPIPGSLVFCPHGELVGTISRQEWWCFVKGASWRSPEGQGSDIENRMDHPVVHVSWGDANAYAAWVGKRLPTEAEWEYAARGSLPAREFVWGDSFTIAGRYMANTFQGDFPGFDSGSDGYRGTAPVKTYPANGFGVYDVAGNVWEWVADWYRPDTYQLRSTSAVTADPVGPNEVDLHSSGTPLLRVTKGGSFLCTSKYCARYRPGGRGKNEPDSAASNLGFRLVKDLER